MQQPQPPWPPAPPERTCSLTLEPLSIAYYCTGHGLGHATRAIEVCKHLVSRGHTVTVVTGAPARVFLQQVPPARFVLRKVRDGILPTACGTLDRQHGGMQTAMQAAWGDGWPETQAVA